MSTRPIRVLLIEDSESDRAFVSRCLKRAETDTFELMWRDMLADGLSLLAKEPFDVLLLDLHLPDCGGEETYRRALEVAGEFPIILMTGHEHEELARQAIRDGVQDYLPKRTLESDLLVRTIRYAIERQESNRRLRQAEERYALAVRGANDGIWDWDLTTNALYLSDRWREMLGLGSEQLTTSPEEWFGRIYEEDRQRVREAIDSHLDGQTPHLEIEYLMYHNSGTLRWVLTRGITIRDLRGRPQRMAGSQTDITERKQAEIQLRHDALHDALTGLPNRTLLLDHLALLMAYALRRADYRYAVLFIDLDKFKLVNDSFGHLVGDQLLMEVGRRLQRVVRPGDTVSRLGGDEFVVLLADVEDMRGATKAARRIHQELEKPVALSGTDVIPTACIGIALGTPEYKNPEDILRDADTALYRAKTRGRSRNEIFDHEMHASAISRLRLETELRQAIEREEFIIHYQPIMCLTTLKLKGFEALVRWIHPERGMVLPDEFIPVAEESGLIGPLGNWVLRESCRQMAEWKQRMPAVEPLTISVNLSSWNLLQPDLYRIVEKVLNDTGLRPSDLHLEITERVMMEPHENVIVNLKRLKTLGVELEIDDFGTGFSSLSYLHRYPIDRLKIDRSFISVMNRSGENREIVRTIANLAGNLNLKVIAEGVESEEQLRELQGMNVLAAQGYFFSRPLDTESAWQLMGSQVAC